MDQWQPSLEYDEPGQFLRHCYELERKGNPKATYEAFSKKIGISLSLLKMLLGGKRNFSTQHVHQIAKALNFAHTEHEYFEAIVHLNQSKTKEETAFYRKRVEKLRDDQDERNLQYLRVPSHLFTSEWYIPSLIVYLIDVENLKEKSVEDINWPAIERKFQLSPAGAKSIVDAIVKTGIIDGVEQQKSYITTDQVAALRSTRRFLKKVAEESIKRLESSYGNKETFFHSHACSLSASAFHNFLGEYKKLLEAYNEKPDDDRASVHQIMMHVWPV
ncbi:MAG: TIGR02147 family protein [Pseudobacteriovorax sp.]|nr:TIGR02147 family protein [Pseudobacteriovorax sp.]